VWLLACGAVAAQRLAGPLTGTADGKEKVKGSYKGAGYLGSLDY